MLLKSLFLLQSFSVHQLVFGDRQNCRELSELRDRQGKPTLNNIGYLGSGYDIIFGNPHPTQTKAGIDPGYRHSIFDLTHYCGDVTADQRYQIPENVTVRKQVSGKLHFNVNVINSTKTFAKTLGSSYQMGLGSTSARNDSNSANSGWISKILSESLGSTAGEFLSRFNPAVGALASGIGKLFGNFGTTASETNEGSSGLAFSASRDFKHVTEEVTKRNSRFIETSATCTVYKASINSYAAPRLSRNFQQAVASLPSDDFEVIEVSDERYATFFNEYGTHVVTSVLMGASYGERYSIDENSWTKIEGRNVDWKLGASRTTRESICKSQAKNSESATFAECMGWTSSQDGETRRNNNGKETEAFTQLLSDRNVFTIGSLPPGNMEVESWIDQSFDNPVPVHLTLDLIVNVLTKQHFPGDEKILKRRAGLLKALTSYCETFLKPAGHVSTCEPLEDPIRPSDDFQCRKLGSMALSNISRIVSTKTGLHDADFFVVPAAFNNKFYLVGKEQISRVRGNEPCRRLSKDLSKLAILEREAEFNCVSMGLAMLNQPAKLQPSYWVGMSRDHGQSFAWENGLPFTYTMKWGRSEPNNNTRWNRYRTPVQSEDFVIMWDEKGHGVVNPFGFNDVSEVADWPKPLCEGRFQRFEIPLQFSEKELDPVLFGKAVVLRNQRFAMPLKGPFAGISHYASLESGNNGQNANRRHCHLHGNWQLEEKGWLYENWKKDLSRQELHFGDVVQISNDNGNPILDAGGSFVFGDIESGWRRSTDDLWRIEPCYPAVNQIGQTVNYGDCVHFENVYFAGNYLYAYQQLLSSSYYISTSNQLNKRQMWILERN